MNTVSLLAQPVQIILQASGHYPKSGRDSDVPPERLLPQLGFGRGLVPNDRLLLFERVGIRELVVRANGVAALDRVSDAVRQKPFADSTVVHDLSPYVCSPFLVVSKQGKAELVNPSHTVEDLSQRTT